MNDRHPAARADAAAGTPEDAARATLAQLLRTAGAELAAQGPPPQLRQRIEAALREAGAAAPLSAAAPVARGAGGASWRPWAWSGAAVCATVLAGSALLMLRLPPPQAAGDDAAHAAFIAVAPPESWPAGPAAAPAWLVATELPGSRLAALGLPYDPARAGESVRAELLMHPSGALLAVRLLH